MIGKEVQLAMVEASAGNEGVDDQLRRRQGERLKEPRKAGVDDGAVDSNRSSSSSSSSCPCGCHRPLGLCPPRLKHLL